MTAEYLGEQYRRFVMGQTLESCGLHFRIEQGTKKPGDLRIDWYTAGGWRAITFEPVFLLVDFLYENEDLLHPPPTEQGGEYLMRGLRRAINHGHAAAWTYVEAEKRNKHNKGTQGGLF